MATVSELIEQGRAGLVSLRPHPFTQTRVEQTFNAIDRAVAAARAKTSEALTILRDPALASKPAIATVAAGDLLAEAIALLDGEQEPEPGPES